MRPRTRRAVIAAVAAVAGYHAIAAYVPLKRALGLPSNAARAIDGDTLRILGLTVRLEGVDAEELDEPNGRRARSALQDILDSGPVTCRLTGARSHGRDVATCTTDGADIGRVMVQAGFALDCARYSGGRYRKYEPVGVRNRLTQKPYC